jgi:hypothetical protein
MAKKQTALAQQYEALLQEWERKPLGGVHTVGVFTMAIGPRVWTLDCQGQLYQGGATKSAKETRATITRHIMRWVSLQNR